MCDHPQPHRHGLARPFKCHVLRDTLPSAVSVVSRRGFIKKLTGAPALATLDALSRPAAAQPNPSAKPTAGRTSWAWLVTPDPDWDAHAGNVPDLAKFIRQETNLELDPTLHPVKPSNLEQLCACPFIFSEDLTKVKNAQELLNLREYLYRGGFIYVDACLNAKINPSLRVFYERHLAFISKLLPGAEIRRLGADHAIFRAYFPLKESVVTKFYTTDWPQALYGVFDDNRMIMLLSLQTLFCGWPQDPEKMQIDLRQITNIYVYALAR